VAPMSANRAALGVAVLVTFVLLISSLGLANAASTAQPTSGTAAAPAIHPVTSSLSPSSSAATPSAYLSAKAPTTTPAPSPSSVVTPAGRMSSLVSQLREKNVPLKYAFLPDLNANPNPSLVNGHVAPTYNSAPAPLGVADYGLRNASGVIAPYTLSTASLEGTYEPFEMSGLSQDISGPDEYGVQLNAVLNNVTLFGNSTYQFWTQNVVEYSTFSHQLFFVSNIWNFSAPSTTLNPNIFTQIGPNGTVVTGELYYGLGGPITVNYPFTLNLYLNSSVIGGEDAVYFNFTLVSGAQLWAGSYDHVLFNSSTAAVPVPPAPMYVANGFHYNPIGLPNDFEITLGGPGGGSNFDVLAGDAYFGLEYWNATDAAYETVPSAYGYGSETGETSIGATVMWGPDSVGAGNPNAFLATGPSYLRGLWNVSAVEVSVLGNYGGYVELNLAPTNAFLFIAQGYVFSAWDDTNWSLFQWAPTNPEGTSDYELPAGEYTFVAVASNYTPAEFELDIPAADTYSTPTLILTTNPGYGVYTPLWAQNNAELANISTDASGTYVLYNQQLGPIGEADGLASFPWFSAVNDYLFPVFPGIFISGTTDGAVVVNPPSFEVDYTGALASELAAAGLPVTNDLQMFFYNDTDIVLENGADIGGWWYSNAYFGPSASAYNVVFWNTSFSTIYRNTFNTGGNALYMYGGTDNLIANNTFEQTVPSVGNPYGTVAGAYGSVGIFEADYGNATDVAFALDQANFTSGCFESLAAPGYCDLIFNNIFLTTYTAVQTPYDPYYFYLASPTCPAWIVTEGHLSSSTCAFNEAWNAIPELGADLGWSSNIIGGPQIGGNYWWNYGTADNPYSQLPYYAFTFSGEIEWGGDYLPLVPYSLYTIEFVETGLPAGTGWEVGADVNDEYQYAYSFSTTVNYTVPSGSYEYFIDSFSPYFAAPGGSVTVTNATVVVDVAFVHAYTVEFTETGLPSGTFWWVDVYNFTTEEYLGFAESDSTTANYTGLLPSEYLWYAGTDGQWWASNPYQGTFQVVANTTYTIHYEPIYTLTVTESGLSAGTIWTTVVWNANSTDTAGSTSSSVTFDVLPGAYHWAALASGYMATPNQGSVTVSANATLAVAFAVAATLTFTETGLASGAAWTVSLVQAGVTVNETSTTGSITFAAVVGAYNYSVVATGYTPTPATGTGVLPSGTPVAVTFASGAPATGALSLTVTTAGATATVNGVAATLPYSHAEAPGIYAIVVSASGYVTYYNNVTVSSGHTTDLSVTLTATSSSSGTSSTAGISTTGWLLIALLGVLAVIFLITTIVMSRRGRSPPNMTPYTPPPAAGASPPPAAGTPAWSEGPGTPPSPPPGAV
jgi:thermopsin